MYVHVQVDTEQVSEPEQVHHNYNCDEPEQAHHNNNWDEPEQGAL